jgi:hypothetical protein
MHLFLSVLGVMSVYKAEAGDREEKSGVSTPSKDLETFISATLLSVDAPLEALNERAS